MNNKIQKLHHVSDFKWSIKVSETGTFILINNLNNEEHLKLREGGVPMSYYPRMWK